MTQFIGGFFEHMVRFFRDCLYGAISSLSPLYHIAYGPEKRFCSWPLSVRDCEARRRLAVRPGVHA